VTYAVHAIRSSVFEYLDAPAAALERLNPPITWFGWEVPMAVQLAIVFVLGMGLLLVAMVQFDKTE
jgi:ABC-2 type transport system permease protein